VDSVAESQKVKSNNANTFIKIGVATASLYPLHTEKALLTMAKLGVKNVEIFLNSTSELSGEIFTSVQNTVKDYGLNILALHPFSSPMETLFLFSSYDRRVTELMELYKRYFEKMALVGAKIFVIHGAISSANCSRERYVERLSMLVDAGREFGITVAQENVSYCKSGELSFLSYLKEQLGDKAKFVLDLKQARRSGNSPFEMLDTLGNSVIHLHLSDANPTDDCMLIGRGEFDFRGLFSKLGEVGFNGGAVVELYRDNYNEYKDLSDSVEILQNLL